MLEPDERAVGFRWFKKGKGHGPQSKQRFTQRRVRLQRRRVSRQFEYEALVSGTPLEIVDGGCRCHWYGPSVIVRSSSATEIDRGWSNQTGRDCMTDMSGVRTLVSRTSAASAAGSSKAIATITNVRLIPIPLMRAPAAAPPAPMPMSAAIR